MTMDEHYFKLPDLDGKEIVPGLTGRFIHSGNITLAYWDFEPDVEVPDHSHEHEQIVNVLEGTFALTVEGEATRLGPGSVVVLPPHASHSGRSITACRILDVFYPVREDLA